MENIPAPQTQQTPVSTKPASVKSLLDSPGVVKRFNEVLGKKAPGFISSIITVVNSNKYLADADPQSVIASAAIAATLDLPINQNLGFAWIVPYNDKKRGQIAQFQMGWKGYVQLAMRTGQYLLINVTEIYAGQLKSHNPVTGEFEWDFNGKPSKEIIGYASYFKLTNGYQKTLYWNVGKILDHAKEYSQAYRSGFGQWKDDFDAMAKKTLVKTLISKWGIMSVEMQTATKFDSAAVHENTSGEFEPEYNDNPSTENAPPPSPAATPDMNTNNIPEANELI